MSMYFAASVSACYATAPVQGAHKNESSDSMQGHDGPSAWRSPLDWSIERASALEDDSRSRSSSTRGARS